MSKSAKFLAIVVSALIAAPTIASAQLANDGTMPSGQKSMGMSKGHSSMMTKKQMMMNKKSGMMKHHGSMGTGGRM